MSLVNFKSMVFVVLGLEVDIPNSKIVSFVNTVAGVVHPSYEEIIFWFSFSSSVKEGHSLFSRIDLIFLRTVNLIKMRFHLSNNLAKFFFCPLARFHLIES